jgi:hypothetical protein
VIQTATDATSRLATAAPGWRKRRVAATRAGNARNATGVSGDRASQLVTSTIATSATASAARPRVRTGDERMVASRRRTGATSRSPPMSPSHQRRQKNPNRSASISSPSRRLALPIVAATIVLTTPAPITSTSTSRTRSSDGRKSKRARSHAPTSASSVLPVAMPRVV